MTPYWICVARVACATPPPLRVPTVSGSGTSLTPRSASSSTPGRLADIHPAQVGHSRPRPSSSGLPYSHRARKRLPLEAKQQAAAFLVAAPGRSARDGPRASTNGPSAPSLTTAGASHGLVRVLLMPQPTVRCPLGSVSVTTRRNASPPDRSRSLWWRRIVLESPAAVPRDSGQLGRGPPSSWVSTRCC